METKLLEAQILWSVVQNPSLSEALIVEEEDFSFYKETFKAIKRLKEEGMEIEYGNVLALTKEIKDIALFVLSEDNFGFSIVPDKNAFENKQYLLKENSIKKLFKFNEIDINLIKSKLEKIHKKGLARWLTGEELRKLAALLLKEKKENTVLYNLPFLDKTTGGIGKGQYIIVAGRPSVGKSAFLQQIGLFNAQRGKKVLFVSVEMSEEMLVQRILKTHNPETIPLTFNILNASDTQTIDFEIQKKARDFDLILIDYIQLLKPKSKTRDLYERVTEISSDIKKMTTKYNLPFICASQFSRRAEGNQPSMADLKESGALEQDADVVISLWYNKEDNDLTEDEEKRTIRLDLLKNRNGATFINSESFKYALQFRKKTFEFYEEERI